MSLIDDSELHPEFLHLEEVVCASSVEGRDGVAVVYVDDLDDQSLIAGTNFQGWMEGPVNMEEIRGEGESPIRRIAYEEEGYDSGQFGYAHQQSVGSESPVYLDPSMPVDDDTNFEENELVPIVTEDSDDETVSEQSNLIRRASIRSASTAAEIASTEPLSIGRRKPATVVQCDVCGAYLKHPSKIEAHMRTHTGEKPFECIICGMRFTQRTPMLNHVRRHMGQTPYVCSYGCGKKFVNNAQKNAHELRHLGTKRAGPPRPHLKPPKRLICTEDPTNANLRISQPEEKRSTMGNTALTGRIPQPISATASRRLDEIIESVVSGIPVRKRKKRSGRAPMLVQCQICGLMLKHASKIKAHIRTHTGDRPYECEDCGASFSKSGTLNIHIKRKHTLGERPFACSWECGKRFVSLATRNEHERVVHVGTKRYECTVAGCFRMFSRRQYLMLHRQREHGLLYKPVFDPQEVESAEREAERQLFVEQQTSDLECHYGESDQVLVDPSTSTLVRVSEDGMVLEPESEQCVLMQAEFVEETEYTNSKQIAEETGPGDTVVEPYYGTETRLAHYLLSDLGPCEVQLPLLDMEGNESTARMICKKALESSNNTGSACENASIRPRAVNTSKRKATARPSILCRRK